MSIRFCQMLLSAVVGACTVAASPVHAQRADRGASHRAEREAPHRGQDFHGRDFQRFTPHERDVWRGGHWQQGWHDNRFAWWWIANNSWYFYPAPVYPYPTYVPPAIIVQPPPVPTGLPPAQFWYYCDNPPGYYPYVAACRGPWREVPAGAPR